jgi:hypothetical protein
MAHIKSALEIAMERTDGIKADKSSIKAHETKQKARKAVSDFLSEPGNKELDLGKYLKKLPGEEKKWAMEGISEILSANLVLPKDNSYKQRLDAVSQAYAAVCRERKQIAQIFAQVEQFFEQYLQNRDQLQESLESQYAPQLQAKQKELAKQFGTEVQLSPMQDPEFITILQKNLARLEQQYQEALNQVKEQLSTYCT